MARFRPSIYDRSPQPVLLGHRGLNTVAPENTLEAIELAGSQGADGVEIDVRLCQLGEPVVVHDADLTRLSQGSDDRAVAAMSYRELAKVDLGHGFGVPRLCDVLNRCQQLELLVNIELKRDVPNRLALVRATLATLRELHPPPPLIISSFDPLMLLAVRAVSKSVGIALLLHQDGPRLPSRLLASLLRASAVHIDPPLATAAAIRRWHDHGLRVLVWTVNHADQAQKLLDLGVDGIISDDPDSMRPIVAQYRQGAVSLSDS